MTGQVTSTMAEERELSSKWKFYNVIILGFGFFLLFTAFQTTANVQVRFVGVVATKCCTCLTNLTI